MTELYAKLKQVAGGRYIADLYWDPVMIYDGGVEHTRDTGIGWAISEETDITADNVVPNSTIFDFKIKQYSAEGVAQKRKVKVSNTAPHRRITDIAFRDKSMNMRIPLQTASECVENTNETGTKVFGLINLVEHTKDNITNSMKQTVQKRPVFSENNVDEIHQFP